MKEFFSFEQQLDKIKKNGLIIDDEQEVLRTLRNEGYYNLISGYSSFYRKDKKYYKDVNFTNVKSLYDFDNRLKNIIYNYASIIECHIKAQVAHVFSEKHGVDEKTYLTSACFSADKNKQDNVRDIITKCNKVISRGIDKNSSKFKEYLYHSYSAHGHIPLWVLVRSLTFGCISTFFDVMMDKEKDEISNYYNVDKNILSNTLNLVVQFRNIVAHGERTFCTKLPQHSLSSKLDIYDKLQIPKNKFGYPKYGRKDFMALMISLKYLLSDMEFTSFLLEFETAFDILLKSNYNLPEVVSHIKKEMGLMGSWKSISKIKL